jgi:hypothetical protein
MKTGLGRSSLNRQSHVRGYKDMRTICGAVSASRNVQHLYIIGVVVVVMAVLGYFHFV